MLSVRESVQAASTASTALLPLNITFSEWKEFGNNLCTLLYAWLVEMPQGTVFCLAFGLPPFLHINGMVDGGPAVGVVAPPTAGDTPFPHPDLDGGTLDV